jgi:hypothetical protein
MSRSDPKLLQTVFGCLKKSPKIDCDLNQKNQPLVKNAKQAQQAFAAKGDLHTRVGFHPTE